MDEYELCPRCGAEEWDEVVYERGREGENPFNRCFHCEHEWAPKPWLKPLIQEKA